MTCGELGLVLNEDCVEHELNKRENKHNTIFVLFCMAITPFGIFILLFYLERITF